MYFDEKIYRHLNGKYAAVSAGAKKIMFNNLVNDHIQALGLLKAVAERIESDKNPEKLLDSIRKFIARREDGEDSATKVNIFKTE